MPPRRSALASFHDATQSLKRYRRAELQTDAGKNLIDKLYEDPLPNNHVLDVMLRPNTTFLIGRKGTGKSTVFQRTQYELRKNREFKTYLSAYLDIKTVWESSVMDRGLRDEVRQSGIAISELSLGALLRYKAFVGDLITDITNELRPGLRNRKVLHDLDALLKEAKAGDKFVHALRVRQLDIKKGRRAQSKNTLGIGVGVDLKGVRADANLGREALISEDEELNYREIFINDYNIKDYILKLKKLLAAIGVRHLFVFVDDFSELPSEAMKVVVDTILAPLNNWSEEFIKFKIACYPGRIYRGEIDTSKVDEITLDIDRLYGGTDIAKVEAGGTDFVRRLVTKRLVHFGKAGKVDLLQFLPSRKQDIWRLLFLVSSGNPRILGTLLFYVYETELIHYRKISAEALESAAQRYYDEKIESDFESERFLQVAFVDQDASFYALKQLLESIVSKAGTVTAKRGRRADPGLGNSPMSSHFCVATELEKYLETLELNFFLTRYQTTLTKGRKKVSVFSLNYGLCRKHHIVFGRGSASSAYYLTPRFDYTRLVRDHIGSSQEIRCSACNRVFPSEQLEALRLYDMACPKCRNGTCEVRTIAGAYANESEEVDSEIRLPRTQLAILSALRWNNDGLRPKEIAEEIDSSYQRVTALGNHLRQLGLVEYARGHPLKITKQARDKYSMHLG
jgi:hypothetical protein